LRGARSRSCGENGFLTVQQEGAGVLVGPGPRIREIAAYWQIALPEPADERER
jgi:hypothetical protein